MTFRLAPRAYRVVVACGFVSVFRAKVNLHFRMKRVGEGQSAQGKEADCTEIRHGEWKQECVT
jgi:hypothetical protein